MEERKDSKKVKIKFIEDLKVDYKIVPMKLRKSRAKEKEETRKMSEKYVER